MGMYLEQEIDQTTKRARSWVLLLLEQRQESVPKMNFYNLQIYEKFSTTEIIADCKANHLTCSQAWDVYVEQKYFNPEVGNNEFWRLYRITAPKRLFVLGLVVKYFAGKLLKFVKGLKPRQSEIW